MTPDDVVKVRRAWNEFTYSRNMPPSTVFATTDWLAYVSAMADTIPHEEGVLVFPSEEECRWAWPAGVTIIFERPVWINQTIVSQDDTRTGEVKAVEPHYEPHLVRGIAVSKVRHIRGVRPDGVEMPLDFPARGVLYIGDDPSDLVTGHLMLGGHVQLAPGLDRFESAAFMLSLVTALGHRLTTISTPTGMSRPEERRIARVLPDLRVLELTRGHAVSAKPGTVHVDWSHRWMVKGHWRSQPCGPARAERKAIWIDAHIKGPDDKPLDVRPTVWEATL